MIYDIEPCPAPRMTQRDKWKGRPIVLRYFSFRDQIAVNIREIPDDCLITFHVAMPRHWSKKKHTSHEGQPHKQKPDLDNYLKALLDAVYRNRDDKEVWRIRAEKRWAVKGSIEIS